MPYLPGRGRVVWAGTPAWNNSLYTGFSRKVEYMQYLFPDTGEIGTQVSIMDEVPPLSLTAFLIDSRETQRNEAGVPSLQSPQWILDATLPLRCGLLLQLAKRLLLLRKVTGIAARSQTANRRHMSVRPLAIGM